ncbi:ribosome small subunit-dependent GTPase A [Desulfuribacillus stibiiarsenatis]|uniref:Small ribosomal subunit biogenesis GTPase RsgA n=1 Tax=Desulfuribacillus stibiiarsenatis TaxID=1390249 RepID=A0A1E5L6H2_9FIRM|nr:ribosome small subunit-dependent GTPase A [Desulfuribacillus stibiiarsenatis]OEH85757.1 ribosome small subunit-dependent GTPase A [Desulfuribacillus stibiiarsenatis]
MAIGTIVKALSGFYYVQDQSAGDIYECRGRGILKKNSVSPLVGDRVNYTPTSHQQGMIEEIMPRTNEFFRPKVANVDQTILVFTHKEPAWNQRLLDRFIVMAESVGVDSLIVINKIDLLNDSEILEVYSNKELYESIGYSVILVSTKSQVGKEELALALKDKISMFSGQSGVGKSSLLNFIESGLELKVGDVSSKLGRGKHTTRHVELYALSSGGFIADTPGFSQIELTNIEDVSELKEYFVELFSRGQGCKYRGCTHITEDGCQVISDVEKGEIQKFRYEHYVELFHEIKEQLQNKY